MKLLRYLSRCGAIMIVTGFVGFIGAAVLCCLLGNFVPAGLELPMGEMGSIAVDRSGTIYCASYSYGRVQVYSKEGKFIRGFFIGGGGGPIKMRLDEHDRLHIYVSKSHASRVFNPDGTQAEQGIEDDKAATDSTAGCPVTDRAGSTYSILTPSICPRVQKTTVDGEKSIIVAVPLYLLIVQGPLPAWFIGAAGMLLTGAAEALEKKRKGLSGKTLA